MQLPAVIKSTRTLKWNHRRRHIEQRGHFEASSAQLDINNEVNVRRGKGVESVTEDFVTLKDFGGDLKCEKRSFWGFSPLSLISNPSVLFHSFSLLLSSSFFHSFILQVYLPISSALSLSDLLFFSSISFSLFLFLIQARLLLFYVSQDLLYHLLAVCG